MPTKNPHYNSELDCALRPRVRVKLAKDIPHLNGRIAAKAGETVSIRVSDQPREDAESLHGDAVWIATGAGIILGTYSDLEGAEIVSIHRIPFAIEGRV